MAEFGVAYLRLPQDMGGASGGHLRKQSEAEFRGSLEAKLEVIQAQLFDEGRSPPEVRLICHHVREAAQEEWRRLH